MSATPETKEELERLQSQSFCTTVSRNLLDNPVLAVKVLGAIEAVHALPVSEAIARLRQGQGDLRNLLAVVVESRSAGRTTALSLHVGGAGSDYYAVMGDNRCYVVQYELVNNE